jgi:cytochrome c oxidase cbb3-type subunit III
MKCCGFFLIAVMPLFAQAPAGGRGPTRSKFLVSRPIPDPAAVERGKALFGPSCGFCHGTNATGGEGPDLVRSAVALRDEGGDEIGPVIRAGRPGMPAFPQMTDPQIKDIAAFLRNRQQEAIDRGSYALKNVNTGDASRGATYFAAHCATCHSVTKDLKGVADKYENSVLMGKIVYPGGRGPAARPSVTVASAGKVTTGTLEYQDDFEVAVRDSSGEYHGFTRGPGVKVDVKEPLAGHEKLMKTFAAPGNDRDLHDVLAYLVSLK